jgi:threonine dehydratase
MPRVTPLAKIEATRAYGAEVILHGDSYDEARAHAADLASQQRRTVISAFDDPLIVAGQGTIGLEIAEDAPGARTVVVPVGGGGLIAGIALAMKSARTDVRVIGVQAQAAPGVARSLADGRARTVGPLPTIADGIAVGGPGAVTFPLLQRYVDEIVLVDEDEISQAMVLLIERSKLIVEGAGAVAVAALMSGKVRANEGDVVAVLSGGNVDINLIARVVEHGLMTAGRYFSLSVGVDDRPGRLAMVSAILAETGANVLSVSHHRFGIALPVGRVQIVLLLEVRDRDHAADVEKALSGHGFVRGAEGGPTFVPATWLEEPADS